VSDDMSLCLILLLLYFDQIWKPRKIRPSSISILEYLQWLPPPFSINFDTHFFTSLSQPSYRIVMHTMWEKEQRHEKEEVQAWAVK
jgi:hypothetical protein